MGRRNKRRKQRCNRWNWAQATQSYNEPKKKKKNKKPKVRWVEDPSIPDKLKRIASLGRTIIGQRSKDGTIEYFQVSHSNK